MLYHAFADVVVLVHLAYIAFAAAGALAVLRWPRVAWLHIPAVLWAGWVELSGSICPLTPLENWLRNCAGAEAYAGSFVEHYIVPVVYPAALTRSLQVALGVSVVLANLLIYSIAWRRWRRCTSRAEARRQQVTGPQPEP